MKIQPTRNRCGKGIADRKVYYYEHLYTKIEISVNNLMIHLNLLPKHEQANPKTRRMKEIIKIRAEMKEMEFKNV
jgi:hypothetical protein